ncbi:hypothetical protein, partial [Alteribacillus persepolensis]|uniref:hypothetical protein n=1 Tax=Alteribacillus persepolensis TaxID=568899 RepID=UPI001C317B09
QLHKLVIKKYHGHHLEGWRPWYFSLRAFDTAPFITANSIVAPSTYLMFWSTISADLGKKSFLPSGSLARAIQSWSLHMWTIFT